MATLRIFMLGPIQFRRDEQVIQLRAAKAIALLAYLALVESAKRKNRRNRGEVVSGIVPLAGLTVHLYPEKLKCLTASSLILSKIFIPKSE